MAAPHAIVPPRDFNAGFSLTLPGPPTSGPEWFYDLCRANDEWQFEKTAQGEILIMAPAGGESAFRESKAYAQLEAWSVQDGTGTALNSNAGYWLPNGASRAPDASWVKNSRLAKLTSRQRRAFLPLCPDFLIEVLSPSDSLPKLQAKMEEYRENGARLGWLIDPRKREVHIYRPGQRIEILKRRKNVAADPELPGFVLNLAPIWKPF